MKLLLMIELET